MTIRIAIDLELNCDGENKPKDIIQLGYSIFSTDKSKILYTGGSYIKIDEKLFPYITKLTAITQDKIDSGVSLYSAYKEMLDRYKSFLTKDEPLFRQICEWGALDSVELKDALVKQGMSDDEWGFGRSSFNIKAMYQMYMDFKKINSRGGLRTVVKNLQIPFEPYREEINGKIKERGFHDARTDAHMTAQVFLKMQSFFK